MCNDKACDHHHPVRFARRSLLAAGAASLAATGLAGRAFAQTATETPPNAIAPDTALARIMAGNGRYAANAPISKDFSAGRAARASAQYPIAGLLSCADARVAPELIFDQEPGDLFVVRVAGNFVNIDGLASLEYGVKFLGVPLIMVLGHSNCGAVSSAIKVMKSKVTLPGHLPDLIADIEPAINLAEIAKASNPLSAAIAQNVRYNVAKLQTSTPIITDYIARGKLKIVGGVYDIGTGKVTLI